MHVNIEELAEPAYSALLRLREIVQGHAGNDQDKRLELALSLDYYLGVEKGRPGGPIAEWPGEETLPLRMKDPIYLLRHREILRPLVVVPVNLRLELVNLVRNPRSGLIDRQILWFVYAGELLDGEDAEEAVWKDELVLDILREIREHLYQVLGIPEPAWVRRPPPYRC